MTVKEIVELYYQLVAVGVRPMEAYGRVFDRVVDTYSLNVSTAKELRRIKALAQETILGRDY